MAAGGQLTHQIEARGIYDVGRVDAWRSSLSIVYDYPWLGTGLGTFASVFSAYRNPAAGVWGVWDHAHSTPLELLVEMGVPFSLLVFALWSIMLGFLVRAAIRGTGNRIYVIAGAGIGTLATLHSLVDFSLQIPGFSLVCCSLVGASIAAALVPAEATRRRGSESAKAPVLSWGSVVQASAIAATKGPSERKPASSLHSDKGAIGAQTGILSSQRQRGRRSVNRHPLLQRQRDHRSANRHPLSQRQRGHRGASRHPLFRATKGALKPKPAPSLTVTEGPSEPDTSPPAPSESKPS